MSLVKGKHAEVLIFRHLLGKKYEVFMPIVDTGVDFVIEPPEPNRHRFLGIQVKTSSYQPKSDWWMWTICRDQRRENTPLFYVLCFEDLCELPERIQSKIEDGVLCFIIPYKELENQIKKRSKAWITRGEFCLSINKQSFVNGRSRWLDFLEPYLNNWDILKQFTSENF